MQDGPCQVLVWECVAVVARAVPGKEIEGPVLARDVLATILITGKHTGSRRQAWLLVGTLGSGSRPAVAVIDCVDPSF